MKPASRSSQSPQVPTPYPTESTRLQSPSMALPLTGHPRSALMQSSLREGQIPISMSMIHPLSRLGILSYRPRSIQPTVNLSVLAILSSVTMSSHQPTHRQIHLLIPQPTPPQIH